MHHVCLQLTEALKRLPTLYLEDERVRRIVAITPDEEGWLRDTWTPAHRQFNSIYVRLDAVCDFTGAAWQDSLHFMEANLSSVGGIHFSPVAEELVLRDVVPTYSVNWIKHAPAWRQLSVEGHGVSNHTDTHPCTCQSDFRHGGNYCTEKLGLPEIGRVVDDAERALRQLTLQPPARRSFAYPCYNSDIGAGPTRTSYVPEIAKRYSAARIGLGKDNDPETVDLLYVYALEADQFTPEEMIARIESAMRSGRWVVLVFHGIGAEWNSVTTADLERVLEYLEKNRPRIWVAPFIDVADRIRTHRATLAQQVGR